MRTTWHGWLVGLLLCSTPCFGEAQGWVEALYWKPINGYLSYVTITSEPFSPSSSGPTRRESTVPGYAWGVCGGAKLSGCLADIRLQGLWMRTTTSSSRRVESVLGIAPMFALGPFGQTIAFVPGIGRVTNRLRNQYWNIRLQVGQTFAIYPSFCLRLWGGGRYANLHEDATNDVNILSFQSPTTPGPPVFGTAAIGRAFHGGGVEIGFEGFWNLGWGISMKALVACSTMVGLSEARLHSSVVPFGNMDFARASTLVVPNLDMGVELSSTYCFLTGAVGYRFEHYWNIFNTWNIVSAILPFSQSRSVNAGYAGSYLSLGARF